MADTTPDDTWRWKLAAETQPVPIMTGSSSRLAMPCLTIAFHDDLRRIGSFCQIGQLITGQSLAISRLEPFFGGPGRPRRPLLDPHISRTPLTLYALPEGDALLIDASASTTPLKLDGEAVSTQAKIPMERLQTGAVIQLAESVVLLFHLRDPIPDQGSPQFGLVGESDAMLQVRRDIQRVAPLPVPVLIRGETGTGKEMVARALHRHGPRADGPLVSVNMAAVPPTLAASELFGSVKGAFTGATQRAGHFAEADGGTLFLDEIGETPEEVQPLLLRALESNEVQPVGAAKPRVVDVRLVAATDADLDRSIADGRFRAPLLHRLAGFDLRLPPLRYRLDDLGPLFFHFLRAELSSLERPPEDTAAIGSARKWITGSLITRLLLHPWPGNVRQLRNLVRQLLIVGQGGGRREVARRAQELLETESTADPSTSEVGASRSDSSTDSSMTIPGSWGVGSPPSSSKFSDLDTQTSPQAEDPEAHTSAAGPSAETSPRTTHRTSKEDTQTSKPRTFRRAAEVSEAELVSTLREHGWRFQPAARALGVSRTTLYRLIERSPRVSKPSEISADRIREAQERLGDDRDAIAADLEVSRPGLDQRIRQLGLEP